MRSGFEQFRSEKFRPFFWVDRDFRISGWPDATARALHVPARTAVGKYCWDVLFDKRSESSSACCGHCQSTDAADPSPRNPPPRGKRARPRCAILPLPGPERGAIVWLPFSHIATGASDCARLEGLVIRGALADSLGSIHATLDSLRRICAADDCEMFLVDPSEKKVILVDCAGQDREAFMERTHMPLGAGYPGAVTLHQKPLFTNRFQNDRQFLRNGVKRCGIRSFIGIPLMDGGRPLGYIGVGWRDNSVPLEWGLRVLDEVKSVVPIAIPPRPAPARQVRAAARLTIRCFGPLDIRRDGVNVPPEAFARRKALSLLRYLVLLRGAPIHREKLIEMLWPESSRDNGVNRLHGVINSLRTAVESGRQPRSSEYVVCREDCYFFNTEAPHSVDLFDFLDAEALARSALRQGGHERAIELFEKAVQLYRGDLFADAGEDESFETHRVRLRHTYLDAARALAQLRIRAGCADEAIRVLRAALDVEPVAADLHETIIAQLLQAGLHAEARQQYECCRAALRRYLDMEPPPKLRALEKLLH